MKESIIYSIIGIILAVVIFFKVQGTKVVFDRKEKPERIHIVILTLVLLVVIIKLIIKTYSF